MLEELCCSLTAEPHAMQLKGPWAGDIHHCPMLGKGMGYSH